MFCKHLLKNIAGTIMACIFCGALISPFADANEFYKHSCHHLETHQEEAEHIPGAQSFDPAGVTGTVSASGSGVSGTPIFYIGGRAQQILSDPNANPNSDGLGGLSPFHINL